MSIYVIFVDFISFVLFRSIFNVVHVVFMFVSVSTFSVFMWEVPSFRFAVLIFQVMFLLLTLMFALLPSSHESDPLSWSETMGGSLTACDDERCTSGMRSRAEPQTARSRLYGHRSQWLQAHLKEHNRDGIIKTIVRSIEKISRRRSVVLGRGGRGMPSILADRREGRRESNETRSGSVAE